MLDDACERVKKGREKEKLFGSLSIDDLFYRLSILWYFLNDGINYRIIFVNYSSMLSRLCIYIEGLFSI